MGGAILPRRSRRAPIRAKLAYLSFSVDGYEKAVYEKARVGGTFETVVDNIVGFARRKKSLGSRLPVVRVKSIIEPGHPDFSPEKVARFRDRFAGLDVELDKTVAWDWNKDYVKSDVFTLNAHAPNEGPGRRHHCQRMYSTVSILWDGNVVPCCAFFDNDIVLGDVSRQSVDEVWNGEPMRRLREASIRGELPKGSPCDGCFIHHTKEVLGVPVYHYGFAALFKETLGYPAYVRAVRVVRRFL